ncbi:MAG: IPT/TIG domain-containing protein, partial [Anaerolineae bacterium]
MKMQRYVAMTPLMIAAAMLFALMGMMVSAISADVVPVLAAPLSPSVTSVSPNSVSNDVNVPIVIDGSGFTATLSGTVVITPPLVYLDDVALADPTWINSTTLSATVPWGLDPGIYTLTVVNPDAES